MRKADLERAGLSAGTEAVVRIQRKPGKVDVSKVRFIRSGHADTSERHDEVLGEAAWEEHRRLSRARR